MSYLGMSQPFLNIPCFRKKIEWKKHKTNKSLKGKENRKPKVPYVFNYDLDVNIIENILLSSLPSIT